METARQCSFLKAHVTFPKLYDSNRMLITSSSQDQFHELSFYTLSHPDTVYFIHQHAVDAFAAQTADENTKPIKLTFGLIGLYLFLEKG
jgi:hypothetical protein